MGLHSSPACPHSQLYWVFPAPRSGAVGNPLLSRGTTGVRTVSSRGEGVAGGGNGG